MSFIQVPLGEIAEINPSSPKLAADEEVSFLPMAHAKDDGTVEVSERRPYHESKTGYTGFANDDVLVAKVTPCFENNKIVQAILPTAFGFGSTEFHVVRAGDDLDARFVLHYLRQDWVRHAGERRMTGSGGQRRVPKQFLEQLPIPKLSLPEQRRIAAILDQADVLRRLRRQSLSRLSDLGQATFFEMFGDPVTNPHGWAKVPLARCVAQADDIRCGPFGTQLLREEFAETGVPLWGIKQVNRGFSIPTHEFVSETKARMLSNYDIHPGDIVMTRKGTIGNCAVYPEGFPPGIMHSDLLRVRLDLSKCTPAFLSDQLHWSADVEHQIDLISGGAIMKGINVGKLKQIEVLLPPLEVQTTYVRRVRTVRAKQSLMQDHMAAIDSLFASLQHRAFRGEL